MMSDEELEAALTELYSPAFSWSRRDAFNRIRAHISSLRSELEAAQIMQSPLAWVKNNALAIAHAVAAEREACALAAIEWGDSCATEDWAATQERNHAQAIAAAIRARGEK